MWSCSAPGWSLIPFPPRGGPALDRIDDETSSLDRQTMVVFVATTILLVVFNYWGLPSRFAGTAFHGGVADLIGPGYDRYFLLLPYQYWGVASVAVRVLAPIAVIVWVLRQRPRDWGFSFRGQWAHVRPYLAFLALMLPLLFLASAMPAFQAKYPLYSFAVEGGWHFWGWQLFYGLQFLGVEAFFRGFMLFGLHPKLGRYAIAVMVIPYTMIHFGKPMPETFAAIVAGYALGHLALKSKSFVWGWMLHWGVAITMDVLVIGREWGFSQVWGTLF